VFPGFRNLCSGKLMLQGLQSAVAARIALERSGREPEIGGLQILVRAAAGSQHGTKHDAGARVALKGSFLEPDEGKGKGIVLRKARATEIKVGEIVLGFRLTVFRGQPIPSSGFRGVLGNATRKKVPGKSKKVGKGPYS
jgi:hypothetical protein